MSHKAEGMWHSRRTPFPPYQHQEAVTSLAASMNDFTLDLYLNVAAKKSSNIFYSPFSIMAALGMTYGGARGNTEEEMRSVLHLNWDKEVIHNAFQDVIFDLMTAVEDYELRTSNLAYISNQLSVLSQYDELLQEKYLSSARTVDFDESEKVRQQINRKVETETNCLIKDLIPPGVLNSLTRMVLVNAVYFKGFWAKPFSKESTCYKKFWTSRSEGIDVPMMYKKDRFRYNHFEDLGASALAMDYQGSRLSMVFVLPDERDGLAQVEARLAKTDLRELERKLRPVEIAVTIPKFKLEETLDCLVDSLKEMGMRDLFDDYAADLSGITRRGDLYVSTVIHKAFVEVNEEGTEAAAATGVVAQTRMIARPIPPFTADHPFMFFIHDDRSGLVLFVGRLQTF